MTAWLWIGGLSVVLGGMALWMCVASKTWWER